MNLLDGLRERKRDNDAAIAKLRVSIAEETAALEKREHLALALDSIIEAEANMPTLAYTVDAGMGVVRLSVKRGGTKPRRQDRSALKERVLQVVQSYGVPISAVDVAALCDAPRTDVGRVLYEYERKGRIRHTGTQGRYLYSPT